jgi:hypothetical protein
MMLKFIIFALVLTLSSAALACPAGYVPWIVSSIGYQ